MEKYNDEDIAICPVCGKTIFEDEGDVCKVCKWFHDEVQEEDPDYSGGMNHMSLNEAKKAYSEGRRIH